MKKSNAIITVLLTLMCIISVHAEKTEKKTDNYVKIDYKLNTNRPDKTNHFHWENATQAYKDSFDAVSGASTLHSTKEFRAVSFDSTGKLQQTPRGLRSLLLYAVSPFETLQNDAFTATGEGRKITITFTHRGTDYKIETDELGMLDTENSFFIHSGDEYIQDVSSESAANEYTGKLKATLSSTGILTLKGKLTFIEKEKKTDKTADIPGDKSTEKEKN